MRSLINLKRERVQIDSWMMPPPIWGLGLSGLETRIIRYIRTAMKREIRDSYLLVWSPEGVEFDEWDEAREKIDEFFDPDVDEKMIEWVHIAGGAGGPDEGWEMVMEADDVDDVDDIPPCNIDDIRKILDTCDGANLPVYVEQVGSRPVDRIDRAIEYDGVLGEPIEALDNDAIVPVEIEDPKGADIEEWPEEIRVRQYPKPMDVVEEGENDG